MSYLTQLARHVLALVMGGGFIASSLLPTFAVGQEPLRQATRSADQNVVPEYPEPIRLHPVNPHYFQWRDRPVALISSAEHYGAVLNLDFDFQKYLDTLAAEGMNYTRIFSGAYVEPEGAFNIARNTLAPRAERFICPWPRSDSAGYANGGNRFDLSRWDDAYFVRLRNFVSHASKRGVVVEMTLFCPMYEDKQWRLSPMNASNNVNGHGNIARTDVYTLDKNGGLLAIHESLTKKIVTELNEFDNVIFEVCNEPYFGGVTMEWQHRIADVILETEKDLPHRHLIAQNIANKTAKIESPHPGISVFNFHYATPPNAVAINYHLDKIIGDDETGFRGTADSAYRTEAWEFMLAGGGLYNNLDYSFAVGHEDGTFNYPPQQPGGGNTGFRRQIRILSEFLHSFEFVRMRPDNSVIKKGAPAGGSARALVEPGRSIAVYLRNKDASSPKSEALTIELAAGTWIVEWIDTKSGAIAGKEIVEGGGDRIIKTPPYEEDIALRLSKQPTP